MLRELKCIGRVSEDGVTSDSLTTMDDCTRGEDYVVAMFASNRSFKCGVASKGRVSDWE